MRKTFKTYSLSRLALIVQNVTVHIIQPGGFATSLTAFKTIENKAIRDFEASPIEVQQYYGKGAFNNCKYIFLICSARIYYGIKKFL